MSGSDYLTSYPRRTESSCVVVCLWVEEFAFLVQLCCDSTSAAVIGSEPGDVIWNVVSPHTFSHNCVVKKGGWFQTTHFYQKKRYNDGKVCGKYKIWETTFKLRRKHFLLNCRRGVCVVTVVPIIRGGAPSSRRRLQEIKYWSLWRDNLLLPLQNLLTASRQLHKSVERQSSTPSESAYSKQTTP